MVNIVIKSESTLSGYNVLDYIRQGLNRHALFIDRDFTYRDNTIEIFSTPFRTLQKVFTLVIGQSITKENPTTITFERKRRKNYTISTMIITIK